MTPSRSPGSAESPRFKEVDSPSAKSGLRTRSTGKLPSAASISSARLPSTAMIGLARDASKRCATRATIGTPSISASILLGPPIRRD